MFMRTVRLVIAVITLVLSISAVARPYAVDDLLRTEDFGTVAFDPRGRWLVFERLEPFLNMSRFDMQGRSAILRSRLYLVDLHGSWQAKPLLVDSQPGTIIYGFSAGGGRLAIGRLSGERWQLGVVTMETGTVRWFDLSPDYSPFYRTLHWLSDDRLAVLAMQKDQRPSWLSADSLPADRLPVRWAATRSGRVPAVTAIGSGRFRAVNPPPVEKHLLLLDAVTGQVSNLASGSFISLTAAPDDRRLALVETSAAAPLPQDRPVSQIDGPFRQNIAIYDMVRKLLWRPCPGCDVLGPSSWSENGRHLAFFSRRNMEDWSKATLFTADHQTRSIFRFSGQAVAPVVSEYPDGSARAAFAWSRNRLFLYGRSTVTSGHRADWYMMRADRPATMLTSALASVTDDIAPLGNCAAAMTTTNGIWCLDRSSPRRLTESGSALQNRKSLAWKVRSGVLSVRIGSTLFHEIAVDPTTSIGNIDVSAAGDFFAVREIAGNGVRILKLVTRHRAKTIATANLHLQDVQSAQVRPLSTILPDGRKVTHWFYLPAGGQPDERLPLVVVPYPGQSYGNSPPVGQAPGAARFQASAQILAGRGYAVLLPTVPSDSSDAAGTPGFINSIERAVDAAIATGRIDPRRLVLWGHSHGAYTVAMVVAHSCRYAAAIAAAGVYDAGATPGVFGPTLRLAPELGVTIGSQFAWAETGQGGFGTTPWTDSQRYLAASPAYMADRISTPMLLIAADRDFAPVQQAEELFSALFRQNKDAELLTYWGEGHVVASPANVRDLYARILDWLKITLKQSRVANCQHSG